MGNTFFVLSEMVILRCRQLPSCLEVSILAAVLGRGTRQGGRKEHGGGRKVCFSDVFVQESIDAPDDT